METHTESRTQTTTTSFRCSLDYLKSINGILKIVQMVLSIIAFACATEVSHYRLGNYTDGFGFVSFVAITGFIMAIIYFIFHLFVQGNWTISAVIELISYAVWTLLFLIAGIVAAALTGSKLSYFKGGPFQNIHDTGGAAAAFSFFCMVAWAVDLAFMAQHTRITFTSGSSTTAATTTHTTTTTTTSTASRYEEKPQY